MPPVIAAIGAVIIDVAAVVGVEVSVATAGWIASTALSFAASAALSALTAPGHRSAGAGAAGSAARPFKQNFSQVEQ